MNKEQFTLHNNDISANYRDKTFHLMLNDFRGAMAYWLASQQINTSIKIGIDKPLNAFTKYMQQKYFKTEGKVVEMTYEHLDRIVNEDVLIAIPELMELNEIEGKDFYDLGALARNVFYMICREQITQPL